MRDKKLLGIYRKLFSRFGRQYWWPAETPFEVMVGAVLTQNTSWKNAERAIENLKKHKLLNPAKLYRLPRKKLASFILAAGYYNIKASRLKNLLDFFIKRYQASIADMRAQDTGKLRAELLGVNGIGQETADSILLYALDKPAFVVDTYTKRVFLRHGLIKEDADYNHIQDLFISGLKKDAGLFNEYHALLVKLGKDFCLKSKPRCAICPLKGGFMRKASLFLILALFFVNSAVAAPCYGTKMPAKHKLFVSLESYSLFKRYLANSQGKLRSQQEFYGMSFGVFDWLSIDLKAGAGNIKQHPLGSDEVDYSTAFAGGYGLRLKFFDRDKVKAVLGFQHISVHPQSTHVGGVKNKAILDDWQWSLLASYDFKKITPYLGARWSRVDYIHRVGDDRKRRMSDFTKDIGLIYGFNLPLGEKIWVNMEGSSLDSDAFAFSLNYAF